MTAKKDALDLRFFVNNGGAMGLNSNVFLVNANKRQGNNYATMATCNIHSYPACCGGLIITGFHTYLHNHGIGRLLDWGVKKYAMRNGYRMLHGIVPDDDDSLGFFEKMGWKKDLSWVNRNSDNLLHNIHFDLSNWRAEQPGTAVLCSELGGRTQAYDRGTHN